MEATLPIIRELTTVGDSVMWIVGPGYMVSENTSRGIREPQVDGEHITLEADNWRFHLDAGLVDGIQFVETYGDLSSHYVRFSDSKGETLLRAYRGRASPGILPRGVTLISRKCWPGTLKSLAWNTSGEKC